MRLFLTALLTFSALSFAAPASAQHRQAPKADPSDKKIPKLQRAPNYAHWFVTVMPGERLDYPLEPGELAMIDGTDISAWRAPDEAGTYYMDIDGPSGRAQRVTVFVLEPLSNIDSRGWLNGYRIGKYPKNAPEGFIKLERPEDRDTLISPHFKIGQFLCKQQPDHWPKYVLVTDSNLRRLETLLRALNEDKTTDAETFFVMSGFRTPFYNSAIGSAKFSRHMYGDAADIYVDWTPRNGTMDDLNKDGKINKADANWLYDYAGKLYKSSDDVRPGGLGSYKANAVHGPFVHVDGRGRAARWGR